jgi:hypothetical protein
MIISGEGQHAAQFTGLLTLAVASPVCSWPVRRWPYPHLNGNFSSIFPSQQFLRAFPLLYSCCSWGAPAPLPDPCPLAPVQRPLMCWGTIRRSRARSPRGCAARAMPVPTTTTARTGGGAPGSTNTGPLAPGGQLWEGGVAGKGSWPRLLPP